MALVDYSDSDSDSETQAPVATTLPVPPKPPTSNATATSKKPFHKLLDRANPGQIVVSLPTPGAPDAPSDEPPAKRARTTGSKSSFTGFNSFLPAPKKPVLAKPTGSASRPVGLKTSADAAFSRADDEGRRSATSDGSITNNGGGGSANGPTIPAGQKPADEVKLVGKPLMFKPLSVARRPEQKKSAAAAKQSVSKTTSAAPTALPAAPKAVETPTPPKPEPPPVKKPAVSLFSFGEPADEPDLASPSTDTGGDGSGAYQPMIATDYSAVTGPYVSHQQDHEKTPQTHPLYQNNPESLTSVVDTMNLTAAERRELFGRSGQASAAHGLANVVNLNMDREYAANEELRASGEAVQHNPLRSIAPGKHSLKQLVNAVQSQKEALEESFAKGKSNRKEAAGRYGWK